MSFSKPIFVLPLALLAVSCGSSKSEHGEKASAPPPPVGVKTAAVQQLSLPEVYEATGTVRAKATATLSARLVGHVLDVRVQVGDAVRAGQTLVVLDAREVETGYRQVEATGAEARSALPEVQNSIAAAKAQLDLANSTMKRMKTLYDSKSISEQEYDEVKAKQGLAQANYEMALARKTQVEAKVLQTQEALSTVALQRTYAEVKAPFAGVVTERRAEPGTLASPGVPLLTIERAGDYRLEAAIEESQVSKVHRGAKATVILDALGRTFEARVSEVVPSLDAASRTFLAKIDLPSNANLKSGLFGRAQFSLGERPAIVIPVAALVREGQVERVYVAEQGIARGRLVSTRPAPSGSLEVLSGLRAGESVIAPVPPDLRDGARIEVRP